MLLGVDGGKADQDHHSPDQKLYPQTGLPPFAPGRANAQREGHMKGRAGIGVHIHRIQKVHNIREDIVPGHSLGLEIHPGGENGIRRQRYDLRHDQKDLEALKILQIIEHEVQHRKSQQEIPAHIRHHKNLIEHHDIIQCTMDAEALIQREGPFQHKIQHQINRPGEQ